MFNFFPTIRAYKDAADLQKNPFGYPEDIPNKILMESSGCNEWKNNCDYTLRFVKIKDI